MVYEGSFTILCSYMTFKETTKTINYLNIKPIENVRQICISYVSLMSNCVKSTVTFCFSVSM